MHIVSLSLFPQEMEGYFKKGLFKKALDKGLFRFDFVNIRDFAVDKHAKVDDTPFAHHRGMLMKPDVLARAIRSVDQYESYRIIYTCPQGRTLDQSYVQTCTKSKGLILISGYYEGIDERIFDVFNIERVSIGDFVLSSGELPALVIAESILRTLPGVVGNPESVAEDSILKGLLEYPQFTQPREFEGHSVPEVLRSGNHQEVANWEQKASLKKTLFEKPNLLAVYPLTNKDKSLVTEILKEEISC